MVEKHYVEEKYVMNKKQKWEYFWEYYRWHVIVAVVIICAIINITLEISNKANPDYTIALISTSSVPEDTLEEMENEVAKYVSDINGDGDVEVSISLYQINYENTSDSENITANVTRLLAELSLDSTFIYIVDDLNYFSHLLEDAFVDENGNFLTSYNETGEEVDDTLYGFALSDSSIFEDITYVGVNIYDIFDNARVLILDESIFENKSDSVKEEYQQNIELYNKIAEN